MDSSDDESFADRAKDVASSAFGTDNADTGSEAVSDVDTAARSSTARTDDAYAEQGSTDGDDLGSASGEADLGRGDQYGEEPGMAAAGGHGTDIDNVSTEYGAAGPPDDEDTTRDPTSGRY